MSLDTDVKVSQQVEDARFDNGERIPIIRVTFMVGKHGPFVERFDKVDFTQSRRDEKLNTFAREVRTP